jgi:diguanylate cyclase (GGDEF)-like protein
MNGGDRKPLRGAALLRRDAFPAHGGPRPVRQSRDCGDVLALAGIDETELSPELRRSLASLLAEGEELRRELHRARARISSLEKLVDEDPLMPVCNRRAFLRELTRMMAFAGRYGVPASLVYFDVNNMKQINDSHGHAAGDAALTEVARVLTESVRATDVVGRLGGDEFGVLLVQTDKVLAEHKAEELAAAVARRPVPWQDQTLSVSVAFGAYAFLGGESASDVLCAADREMYRRKLVYRSKA